MTGCEWLTIIALIVGPLLAVQATRYLDSKKEIRERKLAIFKTLMANRVATLDPVFVEALNRIDLEFTNDKEVISAWKAYLAHHNQPLPPPAQQPVWVQKKVDLLVDLLQAMARVLAYDFDKTAIQHSIYFPQYYTDVNLQNAAVRAGLQELLEGKRALKVSVGGEG